MFLGLNLYNENVLIFSRHMLKKSHCACNLLSNDSEKIKEICVERTKANMAKYKQLVKRNGYI